MSHLNTNFDNVDMDSFLNLPQDDFTPVSSTPSTQTSQLSSQTSRFSSGNQTFSGPSFQYDAYRQQTGIPVGGLANTFAVNQTAGLQHWDGQGSFVLPSGHIDLQGLSKDDDFDFNDLDFEADSPIYGGAQGQFVSPTTLVASSGANSGPIQRIYPGMHSQAAQAKAEQAKQQQEMLRRQQQQEQQPQRPLPAGQKALPKTGLTKDPQVEESISRILNQMRQKSTSSDTKEEDSPISNMSGLPRSRKDDEDMDEDERLLASEEGKKLSSKERRQLRNKVSARAFRSRRKGKQSHFVQPGVANILQNTLVNSRAKFSRRLTRTRCFVPRTSSFGRRTTALPT
jgi:bZIP-type transcription factor MBZ1